MKPVIPFWSHAHVTVLPHISARTNKTTACAIVGKNISRFLSTGEIPAGVVHDQGY
jgi:glyoxylate/hydroxypyruvate reductase A